MSVHQWDPGSILWRAFFFFFFFSLLFFFSSHLSPRLAFLFFPSVFCPPLISSSPFPLPFFLFFFLLFFSHSFSFFFYFLFPPFLLLFFLSFLPLFYFPDFFLLFLSSLFSFFFFFFFFSSLTQNDDFLWFVYSYDRSNWILTDQTGFWSTILADYVFCLILYTEIMQQFFLYFICSMAAVWDGRQETTVPEFLTVLCQWRWKHMTSMLTMNVQLTSVHLALKEPLMS